MHSLMSSSTPVESHVDLLFSSLRSAASDTELTAALLLIPRLHSPLTAPQAELVWSWLPPGYLTRLAASSLSGKESPLHSRVLVSLLSSMRATPSVLHSPSYLHHSAPLLRIAYGEGGASSEVKEMSLECLECVHYIPESHPYLLQANAICTLINGYNKHKRLSLLILNSLQDSDLFPDYSHQVVDVLHSQLSMQGQMGKYHYCEDLSALLSAFTAHSLPLTDSLLLLIGELFDLMKEKDTSKRSLPVRAASRLLSLYDLYTLCRHLSTTSSGLALNALLDLLLLLATLGLIELKLWLDEFTHAGVAGFHAALPQLAYAKQLLVLLEAAEADDCLALKSADKCYHFVCCSLNVMQDVSITLMHLILAASQREQFLPPNFSQPALSLLGAFLSDHELAPHRDLLNTLSPLLVQLLAKVPISQILAELNKFDVSLMQDTEYFVSFITPLLQNLNETMTDFLPAALNFCQHPDLSLRLAESGYCQLLLLQYAGLYALPLLANSPLDPGTGSRGVMLDILAALSPRLASLVPADSPLLGLAATLMLNSKQNSPSSGEVRESESQVVALLKSKVASLASSSPQHGRAALPDASS